MNQHIIHGMSSGSLGEAPAKRRRGRPRKDETQVSPALNKPFVRPTVVTRAQGEGSSAAKPLAAGAVSQGKDHVEVDTETDHNDDKMVGQVVTGVLEYAFDAGYFLTVRVGDTNVLMRGVVFKEDCIVPVTPENDVAPNVKMYKRKDIPIPVSLAPSLVTQQQAVGTSSSSKVTEINDYRQEQVTPTTEITPVKTYSDNDRSQLPEKPSVVSVANQEPNLSHKEPEPVEKVVDKETVVVVPEENASYHPQPVREPVSEVKGKDESPRRGNLDELSEPALKIQKTDDHQPTDLSIKNGPEKEVVPAEIDCAVKPDVAVTATVLPEKAVIQSTESVVVTPVPEPVVCVESAFQISVENGDKGSPENDEMLTETELVPEPEPASEIRPMETE